MSKMDAVRAMREARYAEQQARSGKPRAAPKAAPAEPSAPAKTSDEPPVDDAEALCGHRNMSGRTCTRERGHAAKSHRYS